MADNVLKGTQPKCHECQTLNRVNSYCRDCKNFLCDKCKNGHEKSSKSHEIIGALDGMLVERREQIMCQKHEQYVQFYCNKCSQNACGVCLTDDHKDHDFEQMSSHAKTIKDKFSKELDKANKRLGELRIQLRNLKEYEDDYHKEVKIQIGNVSSTAKNRETTLDEHEIIENLKREEEATKNVLQKERNKMQDTIDKQQKLLENLKTELSCTPDPGIKNFANNATKQLHCPYVEEKLSINKPPLFSPSDPKDLGSKTLGTVKHVGSTSFTIGRIRDLSEASTVKLIPSMGNKTVLADTSRRTGLTVRDDLDIITRFTPGEDTEAVLSLCTTDDYCCWVGVETGEDDDIVLLVNQNGVVLQTVHLSHYANYMTLTSSGNILVSGVGSTKVSCVNRQGQKSTFLDISGPDVRCVAGLACTENDDVFVCVRMKPHEKDKIIKFSAEGKQLLQLDPDCFESDKLYGVHDVSQDKFCTQDGWWEDGDSKLVVFDEAGNLIKSIRRVREMHTNIKAMIMDDCQNILAGEWDRDKIHIFRMDGTCKRTFRVPGSQQIWGLALGEDNLLWIGTSSGEIIKAKYLK